MSWEIYEKAEDKDGVKEWSLFIVMKGEQLSNSTSSPLKMGYWFFGKDDGDPAGKRLYKEGLREAKAEVERLNRLSVPPRR